MVSSNHTLKLTYPLPRHLWRWPILHTNKVVSPSLEQTLAQESTPEASASAGAAMGRKVTRTPATGPDVRAKGLDSETLGRSIGQCLSVKGHWLRNSSKGEIFGDTWDWEKDSWCMKNKIGSRVWEGNFSCFKQSHSLLIVKPWWGIRHGRNLSFECHLKNTS